MASNLKIWDKVIRLDLESPHTYIVKAIKPEYVTIARYEKGKPWFTFVDPEQLQKVGSRIW